VEAAVKVSKAADEVFEAAVKVLRLLEAAVEVFKAAVEVEAAMYRGCYRGRGRTQERALVVLPFKTAVEVSRPPLKCQGRC
jgi:hypothetical protein